MDNVQEMQQELGHFRSAGGGTVCELSVTGIRSTPHRPDHLALLSRQTGVHIVHGTGYYCHNFLPDEVHGMSVEEMRDVMMREICEGVEGCSVRCGVIYIGCSWPLHNTEKKALQAAAAVQQAEGN